MITTINQTILRWRALAGRPAGKLQDRKKVVAVVMILLLPGFSQAEALRNVTWGMSKIDLIASEVEEPVSFSGSTVLYRPEINGRKLYLQYRLVRNRLIEATYIIVTTGSNQYQQFKAYLIKNHGNPDIETDNGPSQYMFVWHSEGTKIVMKPGTKRRCLIQYSASKLQHLEAEVKADARSSRDEKIQFMF